MKIVKNTLNFLFKLLLLFVITATVVLPWSALIYLILAWQEGKL